MNASRKLIALLLLAMTPTAFAVTDIQVFAYAEANYPSLFTGTATAGQYQQYNYRYYPGSGNYLAVDTAGMIFVLGPFTGGVITSVGTVTDYASYITAWEATQTASVTNIVGGWYGNNMGQAQSTVIFTFTNDGAYYLAEDGNSTLDPSGQDGMEYGAYTWSPTTGAFAHGTTFDTNGQWGMSHGAISSVSISGDTLLLDGTLPLTRVIDVNKSIVGSWYIGDRGNNRIFTFLSDGTFLSAGNEDPALDPFAQKGMERGTYTWDATTGDFTHTTTVNTDGQGGLSHSICSKMQVSGNFMTGTCTDLPGQGNYPQVNYIAFTRITN